MLSHPVFHGNSNDTYKQEILPTFMLAYGVYITFPQNWVKVEEIDIIQC